MKKVIKIVISVILFVILRVPVNAESTCTPPIVDNGTGNNRELSCDASSQNVTKFKYPETGDIEVFKNDLCSIKCSEELVLGVDPIKNVRAGMGFNYPLYVSGNRTCNADYASGTTTYDYKTYDAALRDLVSQRNGSTKGSAQYQTFVNQISNMIQIKDNCDKWKDTVGQPYKGQYSMSPNISLNVSTSTGSSNIAYKYKASGDYNPAYTGNTTSYSSCDLDDKATNPCKENPNTLIGWGEVARIDGRYTMEDRIIEKYTGKVVTEESNKTCKANDVFFTSFYEATKPISGDKIDKGYVLTLTANNLGNNILKTGNQWNLTVNCWYTVQNLIFPQAKTSNGTSDENYDKYGDTGFLYRIIDLGNPFPNRDPGENWAGKTELITDTKDTVRNKSLYTITLNADTIKELQDYNDKNSYDDFDLSKTEKSTFIEQHSEIIKRG